MDQFTGERLVPGASDLHLWTEHVARYRYAARLVRRRRVLDLGCGVGYGAAILLRGGARLVAGVDSALAAVATARARSDGARARLSAADALALPFADRAFDAVVALEVIEHVVDHRRMLAEARRVLEPGGLAIFSTPNRTTYRDESDAEPNRFHVHEFYRRELEDALREWFDDVRCFGQWTVEGVLIGELDEARRSRPAFDDLAEGEETAGAAAAGAEPDYFLAVGRAAPLTRRWSWSRRPHPRNVSSYLLSSHQLETLRRLRLELQRMRRDLDEKRAWALELDAELGRRNKDVRRLEEDLDEKRSWALLLDRELTLREAHLLRALGGAAAGPAPSALRDEIAALRRQNGALNARLQAMKAAPAAEAARLETSDAPEPTGASGGLAGADGASAPASPSRSERPRRVLLVAAGPAALVAEAKDVVEACFAPCAISFLVSPRQNDVLAELSCRAVRWTPAPAGLRPLLPLIRELRRARYDLTVVLLAGVPGYRYLTLAGLLGGWPRAVMLDERLDLFASGGWPRLARRRMRQRLTRLGQRTLTALGLDQGGRQRATLLRWSESAARAAQAMRAGHPPWQGRVVLRFLPVKRPLVSIIVPARDQWDFTLKCLTSLLAHTTTDAYEIVLVDDCSRDETRAAERLVRGIRVLHRRESSGYLGACRAGADVARGKFLLFFNNDIVVRPGWLPPMLAVFEARSDCGAVGPKLVYPDGRLQEAGGIVWQDGNAWNFGRNGDTAAWVHNYLREVDYCSGAALMVRRDAWERVGGFDERYGPGYWEDTDLCFALRAIGLTVWYQPASVLEHFEGASAGTDETRGMKRFQAVNRGKFRQKWAQQIAAQVPFDPQRNLFLARDRNRGPVILVFDHYVPTPDRDAGSYFMHELLDALVSLGCRVIFWPDNLHPLPGYTERLQAKGIEVVYGAVTLRGFVAELGTPVDAAIVHRCKIAARYLPELRLLCRAVAYVAADLEHLREERRCAVHGEATADVEALRRREAEVIGMSDCVTVHSPVERALLERDFPTTRVLELPLPSPRSDGKATSFAERRDLLFLGSTHPPNVDAVVYCVEEILPRVRRAVGDVRLLVLGEVCRDVAALAAEPGVELVGYVEDLEAWLGRARLFVSPLRYGAGIKGKILTAMNAGLPVVTTAVGAEGIGLVHGGSALIADTASDFAAAVVKLYSDPSLWDELRREALQLAQRRYGAPVFRDAVRRLLESLREIGDQCDDGTRSARPLNVSQRA